MWTCSALPAVAGGRSPHSSSITRSALSVSLACSNRSASNARCLPPPSATSPPSSRASNGPRMAKSTCAQLLAEDPRAQGRLLLLEQRQPRTFGLEAGEPLDQRRDVRRRELGGDRARAREEVVAGDRCRDEADRQRLARVEHPPCQAQLARECRGEDGAGRGVARRDPAAHLREAERRGLARDPQVAQQRERE